MRIHMSYGRNGLPLEIGDDVDTSVIRKPPMPLIQDPAGAILEALRRPVASRPLRELAADRQSACILICDITRPVPNGLILPVVLRELLAGGMKADQIRILIATGLHRPNLGDELREVVGDQWVVDNFRIENHVACNEADHVDLGVTRQGTRVKLDRRVVEADLRLVIGLVEPHFMAGYSGGRKLIMPGAAHHETIRTLHNAAILEDPLARNCQITGNPLHEQQLEIVERLGGALAVNVIIDESRRLAFANFGEIVASHLAAVDFVRRYAEVPIARRYQTVVTSAAGYPLDRTYYQTVKGMVSALGALEDGGDLIVVSECSEGLGSESFIASQRRLLAAGPDAFLATIMSQPLAEIDEWQTHMQVKAMRRGRVLLYAPSLRPEQMRLTGVEVVSSLSEALRQSLQRQPGRPALAVIPEGPYVIPVSDERSPVTGTQRAALA